MEQNLNKEQINKIRNYYRETELFLPYSSGWRFFRFKLPDGKFKNFCINNIIDFRKLLVRYTPIVTYASSGCWLNSENIKGNKTKTYQIFISSDLIFDIDNEDLEKAKVSALNIIKKIGKPDYILMTRRGFHVAYYKLGDKRKEYCKILEDIEGLDIKATINKYGVFSIPLTLNKGGRVNIIITYEQLKNLNITQLQALQQQIYTPLVVEDTSEKPKKANEEALKEHPRGNLLSSRSKVNAPRIETEGTILGFSNQVTSRKHKIYIPILIYDRNLKGLKQEINRLVKQYDLGNLYLFINHQYICFISLKVMSYRQLKKVLNSGRSITKNQMKFKKLWLDYTDWEPFAKINNPHRKFFRASRKHNGFLIKCGFKTDYDELVGKTPLEIYEVMKR